MHSNYVVQYLLTCKVYYVFTVVTCPKETSDDIRSCQLLTGSRFVWHAVVVTLRAPAVVEALHELRRVLQPRGGGIRISEW